ncbi:LysE type translocator [Caloramator mitchellensis]|uniref:LysE type translocator n=1 Tax=Caloramator mitchellensis TaxID=908809 RepID=A0A0R3K242_CALMK|nr:LysE family transporter [Caloramator mitchellensis]KRQ87598.1 LysE type translocator [Caloramator mitchellensis]
MKQVLDLFKAIFTGLISGIVFAIPLGPAGIESVKRTLNSGFKDGILVAIGAVGADALDLIMINFGLFSFFDESKKLEGLFFIFCGILILFFSLEDIIKRKRNKKEKYAKFESNPLLKGFILAITNPLTHSVWLTVSGTIIHQWRDNGFFQYILFISFLIIGMLVWFVMLNYSVIKGKQKFNDLKDSKGLERTIDMVLAFTGLLFIIYGIIMLYRY